MSQDRTKRAWRRRAVLLTLLSSTVIGCSPSTLFFMMRGDDKRKPETPLPAKKGKDEVTVAIFSNGSPTMSLDFAGCERDLAQQIGAIMVKETAKDDHPIRVIEQSKVERLKATSGRDWRTANMATLGQQLGADYVIDLTVQSMTLGSREFGGEFVQGQASVSIVVYDTDTPEAPLTEYPHSTTGEQKGVFASGSAGYRKSFLTKVATEIAHRHIPYVVVQQLPNR